MNYTSSQSFHTLNHWQSNKHKAVIPLPDNIPVHAFIIDGVEYRFPLTLTFSNTLSDVDGILSTTPAHCFWSNKPIRTSGVIGCMMAVWNKLDNVETIIGGRGYYGGTFDLARTKTQYNYSNGWTAGTVTTDTVHIISVSQQPSSDVQPCIIPVVDVYPMCYTKTYFSTYTYGYDWMNSISKVDSCADSIMDSTGRSVMPDNCTSFVSDSYESSASEYVQGGQGIDFGGGYRLNAWSDIKYDVRPCMKFNYTNNYVVADTLPTFGWRLGTGVFPNTNTETAGVWHQYVSWTNSSGSTGAADLYYGFLYIITGWQLKRIDIITGDEQ